MKIQRVQRIKKKCLYCQKPIELLPCFFHRIYCSRACSLLKTWQDGTRQPRRGHRLSEDVKKKISDTLKRKSERHQNWRGDNVKYTALHQWVYSHYGKAYHCENKDGNITGKICKNKSRQYDWAKKEGFPYSRNRESWFNLCRSCHIIYDRNKN